MRTLLTLIGSFLLLGSSAHVESKQSCDYDHLIHLQVTQSGTVIWDGVSLKSREELIEKFRAVASAEPQRGFKFEPDKHAKYEVVALILADAQSAGAHCWGFTGLDQPDP